MSDDNKEKSEEPTGKRLADEAGKGNVPVSREVYSCFSLLGALIVILYIAPMLLNKFVRVMRTFIERAHELPIDGDKFSELMVQVITISAGIVAPIIIFFVLLGFLSSYLQNGLIWAPEAIGRGGLARLNPFTGFMRLFGASQFVEIIKGLVKVNVFTAVAFVMCMPIVANISGFPLLPWQTQMDEMNRVVLKLIMAALLVMVPTALLDWFYQKWNYARNLRMTKQEVKDEFKQQEGDPEIKAKIRSMRMRRMKGMITEQVKDSTVVVVNPTHYAVALDYKDGYPAPICTAKAVDELALFIRELAVRFDIPIYENPPLARTLYANIEVGKEVPFEHWEAVAEVIRFVYQLKGKK